MARVLGPHGIGGELACAVLTDFPERFEKTDDVLLGDQTEPRKVERRRLHGGRVILKLSGIDDRTTAEALRGALVQVPIAQAVELPSGSYFWHQIIGLRVEDESGQALGEVTDVLATGSNDVYVVRSSEGEVLIPAIKDVVRDIDLQRGRMLVELIPGLLS